MALTRGTSTSPGTDPAVPAWVPAFGSSTVPARPPAQLAVFGVCALTMVIVAGAAEALPSATAPVLALVAGIAVGLTTGVDRLVRHVAGIVMAVVAMVVTSIGLVALGFPDDLPVPPITIVAVGCFVLGVDWQKAGRLRLLPFVSGVFVIPVVGFERGWAYPAALVWLAAAVGALWLLQDDERAALPRPAPLVPSAPSAPPAGRPADVAGTLGLALAIGVAAALLLGRPSCSTDSESAGAGGQGMSEVGGDPSGGQGAGGQGFPGQGSGGQGSAGQGAPLAPEEIPPERRSGGGTAGDAVGEQGGEREIPVDEDGDRYLEDPQTGERYDVTEEGGRTVVRDGEGNVVAELDEGGVVAGDPGSGDSQRYRVDEDGRYYVEGRDGERLHLGVDEEGNSVLTDGDGDVVARGGPSDDHLYTRDPEGDVLVPDPDGDGRIPVPDGGVRSGLPGTEGTEYESDGDDLTATDPDGEVRTYDRDAAGRERVQVERPGEPTRTYVYDDRGDEMVVLEYDEDGNLLRRWTVDPDGVLVDPPSGAEGTPPAVGEDPPSAADDPGAAEDGATAADEQDDDEGGGRSLLPWIVAGLAALGLGLAGAWWWSRRRPAPVADRAWAEVLVTRIEDHGAALGRPRAPDETIVAYTSALAADALPDTRLPEVGVALSAVLFGPAPPPPGEEARLTAVVDEVIATHPVPSRADRRRARRQDDERPTPVGAP